MFLGFGVCLILACLCYVDCLTCLQCLNIESPRHCKHVKECSPSEVCYVNQKLDEYGEVLFDIGCKNASRCSNRSHGTHDCDYCCNSSLCNAEGCGQPGYPSNRGPICYSCSTHTNQGSCQKIDSCDSHEVCMVQEEREFGDRVHTSKCASLEQCEPYKPNNVPIVGRSLSDQPRSATETICHQCCHGDLCKTRCTMKDCKDIGLSTNISGVYSVRPEGTNEDIEVHCDMVTDGGGLKYIHAMTYNASSELRIELMATDGSTAYEVYPNFWLSASPDYTLHIDPGHGTAGDDNGMSYHNRRRFQTYDHYDRTSSVDCGSYHAGWWFYNCAYVNLNGQYGIPGTEHTYPFDAGIIYYSFKRMESLKETKMMFRRVKHLVSQE